MATTNQKINYIVTYVHNRGTAKQIVRALREMDEGSRKAGKGIASMAARAVSVIPIWLALRSAYMAVIRTFQTGVKHIVDFDKAMARATAVTHGVKDVTKFIGGLRKEVQQLALETGVSVDKIAEAFYRFGTAGIEATTAQEGMRVSLKTSVAIMGDLEGTAKIIADVYNIMGDNIKDANTPLEKMEKIGSTMAVLWKSNAFSLNEFNASLASSASIAKNFGLSLDELFSLLATAATLGQRGGTAGTRLVRSFQQGVKNIEQIAKIMGKSPKELLQGGLFDVYVGLLEKMSRGTESATEKTKKLMDIFGMKGIQVTASLVANMKKFVDNNKLLIDLPLEERIKIRNALFELQNDILEKHIARIGEVRKLLGQAFIKGLAGAVSYKDALIEIKQVMEDMKGPAYALGEILKRAFIDPVRALGMVSDIAGAQKSIQDNIVDFERTDPSEKQRKRFYKDLGSLGYDEKQMGVIPFGRTRKKVSQPSYIPVRKGGDVDLGRVTVTKSEEQIAQEKEESEKAINQTIKERFSLLDRLQVFGVTSLVIEKEKLRILEEYYGKGKEVAKQQQKITDMMTKELVKFSQTLEKSFSKAFEGLIKGESGLKDFIGSLGKTYRDTIFKEFSGLVTRQVFRVTGIGDMFSKQMSAIKHAGDYNAKIWYKSITDAGATIGGGRVGTQAITGTRYADGGVFGGGGGMGEANWFQTPIGGTATTTRPSGFVGPMPQGGFKRRGFAGGKGASPTQMGGGALLGYSQYQSSRAGGLNRGVSTGAGIATGVGAIAGMAGGFAAIGTATSVFGAGMAGGLGLMGSLGGVGASLLAMGPLGWIALGAILIGGLMGSGAFGGKEKSRQVEAQEQTRQVASRIDVSNRELSWINRNLVALRQEMSFMMQNSAYFSERDEVSNFAIGSQRGNA